MKDVLKGFLEHLKIQIASIREGISRGDAEKVRDEAHAIKGGAANLTADDLSLIASELETIGAAGTLKGCNSILEKLNNEYLRLKDFSV